jgi:hypothetical protein
LASLYFINWGLTARCPLFARHAGLLLAGM